MTNFEELQNSWLSQPVEEKNTDHITHLVQDKLDKHQRKLLRSNLLMSGGFLIASLMIAWVYVTYHQRYNWPFDVSMACVLSLMIVYSGLSWKSHDFRKDPRDIAGIDYLNNQIGKLKWQKKMLTVYIWVYTVLFWLAMVGYLVEITKGASLYFTLITLTLITLYIAGISVWNRFYKQKKQLKTIDELLKSFEQMRDEIG